MLEQTLQKQTLNSFNNFYFMQGTEQDPIRLMFSMIS